MALTSQQGCKTVAVVMLIKFVRGVGGREEQISRNSDGKHAMCEDEWSALNMDQNEKNKQNNQNSINLFGKSSLV